MKQIAYNGKKFITQDVAQPKPSGFELLVTIDAISINPIDVKRKNLFVPSEQMPVMVLGYDATGVVEAVGEDVRLFKTGDRVFYSGQADKSGSNADKQLVDERIVGLAPKTLNAAHAASLPLTAITAWESLFDRLRIDTNTPNQSILFIGAAGGVGSIAIQLAKKLTQLTVIATASRPESQHWCHKMGADSVIDHSAITTYFQTHPAPDFIVCLTQPDEYFEVMAKVIKPQGSICLLANTGKDYDINLLKTKSLTLVWEFMATRPMLKTDDMAQQGQILGQIARLIDEGVITSTLTDTLNGINETTLNEAHRRIAKGDLIGKLALVK